MFLVIKNEFADGEFAKLCELLDLLDQKISEIILLIRQSNDPDSEGLCDRGEYFIGVGFVAIQQYFVDTLLFTGIEKNDAYDLGPVHPTGTGTGITYVRVINSAANWWKHEAEWFNKGVIPKNGERNFADVTAIADTPYALSNVLASICSPNNLSFRSVVPHLIEWRAAVHNARQATRAK